MEFDFVERRTFRPAIIVSFLVFLFLPLELGIKIFLLSLTVYFFILFFLCTYWANEWHPERKFIIGFLVSLLHSFVFLLGGFIGLVFAQIVLKFLPPLLNYFRGILIWR
jgi:cell shape-determining protein MreD